MRKIDIIGLEPTKVSTDMGSKFFFFYGEPKIGKTSLAMQFPQPLLLAFEKGYNALSGIYPVDINSWSEVLMVISQLRKSAAKEKYRTIVVDTVDIMYKLCEEYICANNNEEMIKDIPYGAGYGMVDNEFSRAFRSIIRYGYGLVIVAHAKIVHTDPEDQNSPKIITPDVPKRAFKVVNALVDFTCYLGTDDIDGSRHIYYRQGEGHMAGSHFKHLPSETEISYEALKSAIENSITASEKEDGVELTDAPVDYTAREVDSYDDLMNKCSDLWVKFTQEHPTYILKVSDKLKDLSGHEMRISEITKDQIQLLELIYNYMSELDAEGA